MSSGVLAGLAAISLAAVGVAGAAVRRPPTTVTHRTAAELMASGTRVIAAARRASGELTADDVNHTGLIGLAHSPITSSVGLLVAKRTATNPNWGAVVVEQLRAMDVQPGDVVAAGFSGSFPGLNLATIAAARALRLRLLVITGVSASNYGANDPTFTWLDMERALRGAGWGIESLAASIGGVRDVGADLPPGGQALARAAIARAGVALLDVPTLAAGVRRRLAVYDTAAEGSAIRAFVSVGGAQANLGACDESFLMHPGIIRSLPACPHALEGVAHYMLRRGIPVLSLLNVRALAVRYTLPLDPMPLPRPDGLIGPPSRTYVPGVLLGVLVLIVGVVLRRTV